MTKKASKSKPKAKIATKTPASRKAKPGDARGRKLGERTEEIIESLSPSQIATARERVCDLTRSRNALDDKRQATAADYRAKLKEIDGMIEQELQAAASGRRTVEVTIEEWLTPQNQVVRYRTDTGELIGDRVARPEDLQETLPLGDDEPDESEAEPEASEAGADDASEFGAE